MARRSPDPVTEVRPVGTNRWARWGTLALLPALIWAILAGFLAYAASYYIPGAQSLRHGTLPALVATGGAWIAAGCGVKGIIDYRSDTSLGGLGASVAAIAGGVCIAGIAFVFAS